jgi:hypothetical protein
MTQSRRKRIGRIGLDVRPQAENHPHHALHLGFLGATAADDGLLYTPGRILVDRQIGMERCTQSGRARLAELQRAVRVAVEEYALDRDFGRFELADYDAEIGIDAAQPRTMVSVRANAAPPNRDGP